MIFGNNKQKANNVSERSSHLPDVRLPFWILPMTLYMMEGTGQSLSGDVLSPKKGRCDRYFRVKVSSLPLFMNTAYSPVGHGFSSRILSRFTIAER